MLVKSIFILVIINFPGKYVNCQDENGPIVSLPEGKIRGHVMTTNKNKQFFAFQEIPYAAKPIGELRFRSAIEPPKWEGILNATKSTKICMQWNLKPSDAIKYNIKSSDASEDCLYLNVYTPITVKTGNDTLLPVLVYIHGGIFALMSGIYRHTGPDYFINHDVIVVTINFRLGAFGFLSTQDDVILGNQGLKDQHFALKWINRNIHLFGGDPNKVTIAGKSTGAFSVGYHILSPKSTGLFRAGIMASGSALSATGYQKRPREIAYKLCQLVNPACNSSTTSKELLKYLQEVDADILNSINLPQESGLQLNNGYTFAPTIEIDHPDAFLTKKQYDSLEKGNFNKVPILIGITSEERLQEASNLTEFKNIMAKYDNNLSLIVNEDFNILPENRLKFAQKLRRIYTTGLFQNDLGAAVRFKSDSRYNHCTISEAFLQAAYNDVFFYQFSYLGSLNVCKFTVKGAEKVDHMSDLNYFLRSIANDNLEKAPERDQRTVDRFTLLWTNFVKYLNPTPEKVDLLENITWPLMKQDNMLFLDISENFSIKKDPKQFRNWLKLIKEFGKPPFDSF